MRDVFNKGHTLITPSAKRALDTFHSVKICNTYYLLPRTMSRLKIISVICLVTLWTINAEKDSPSLAEDMDLLKGEIRELKKMYLELKELREENMMLKEEMSRTQSGRYVAGEVFDCSNTESSFTEEGVLPYDVCSVDTTLDSPLLTDGYFKVSQEGIYRLTFMGCYFIPPVQDTEGTQPFGMALLLLDIDGDLIGDTLLARSFLNPIISDTAGYFTISLETIQQLSPGQNVFVQFDWAEDARLNGGDSSWNHFTGQFLGTAQE